MSECINIVGNFLTVEELNEFSEKAIKLLVASDQRKTQSETKKQEVQNDEDEEELDEEEKELYEYDKD